MNIDYSDILPGDDAPEPARIRPRAKPVAVHKPVAAPTLTTHGTARDAAGSGIACGRAPARPATHAALQQPGARTHGANVVILSADPVLIDLLRDAVAGHHRVWRADDATHAADLMVASGNAVLLIDAALADHDTKTLVTQVHQQFPDLAIIVAGRRDDEHELAPLVSEGTIFRFLHKPASAERIRNFVDATQRRTNGTDLIGHAAAQAQEPALRRHRRDARRSSPPFKLNARRRLLPALGTQEPPARPGRADRLGHRGLGAVEPQSAERRCAVARRRNGRGDATPPRTRACRRCWTPPGSRSRRAR